jgi:Rrf2 family protein
MQLSNQVEWAIHCVVMLGCLPEDAAISGLVMAEFHAVPREYLGKALRKLSAADIVTGGVGPRGGYRLARPAKDITLLDIVEAIEGSERAFRCTEIRQRAPAAHLVKKFTPICTIAAAMYEAEEAWKKVLRSHTIAMVIGRVEKVSTPEVQAANAEWIMNKIG